MQKKGSTIVKALVYDEEVSLAVLDTTALVQEAIDRHALSAVAAAALGRTLTATAYLCSWLKDPQCTLSVTLAGGGAGGTVSASGDGRLFLRGFLEHPEVTLPPRADGKLDVGGCIGKNGTLTVIRDDGEGIPFVGTSALVSGEVAEDFSAYFLLSEQRPTAIALGVKIGTDGHCLGAGGVFLQPLPFAREEHFATIEREISRYGNISSQIEAGGIAGILARFDGKDLSEREIFFRCRCSRERAERAVLSLGRQDAEHLLAAEGVISVHCHDCNTDYTFDEEDIARIFREEP